MTEQAKYDIRQCILTAATVLGLGLAAVLCLAHWTRTARPQVPAAASGAPSSPRGAPSCDGEPEGP